MPPTIDKQYQSQIAVPKDNLRDKDVANSVTSTEILKSAPAKGQKTASRPSSSIAGPSRVNARFSQSRINVLLGVLLAQLKDSHVYTSS
jgi:hypothetical protein